MSSLVDSPSTAELHGNSHESGCSGCLDRRQVLVRAGFVTMGVAAAGVLAACGGGSAPSSNDKPTTAADGALATVSDIPEGGAISATDASGNAILLTQPTAGTVVALSAICTHQGCTVAPGGKQLVCPCHGSVYDLTGANVSGPAPKPLATVDVHVTNGEVFAGKA
jgi:Rieske Fe-S protein